MNKVYILRGRTAEKTVAEEATDPLRDTFSEVYASRDAAMLALRAHLNTLWGYFSDENVYIDPAEMHLSHFRGEQFGWYFNIFDAPTKEEPVAAEWVMTATEEDDGRHPVLPYFVVEAHDLLN